jgi:hypothetical protein
MKDRKDKDTQDWVDADEERRFKEARAMVRRKLRQEKLDARKDSETTTTNRTRPES